MWRWNKIDDHGTSNSNNKIRQDDSDNSRATLLTEIPPKSVPGVDPESADQFDTVEKEEEGEETIMRKIVWERQQYILCEDKQRTQTNEKSKTELVDRKLVARTWLGIKQTKIYSCQLRSPLSPKFHLQ